MAALVLFAARMVDGHLHRAPHEGVLVHCGPYVLEAVVRDYRALNVWLMNEKERAVSVDGRSLRARGPWSKGDLALNPVGDHFQVALPRAIEGDTRFDLELRDGGGHTYRASLLWRNIDDVDRMNRAEGFMKGR